MEGRIEFLLFNKIILPLNYSLMKRKTLQIYSKLKKNENLSKEEILRLQFDKLKELINHAYQNVKFYRKRFDQAGVKPEDISSLDDYAKLPVVTKQDLIENIEEFVASNFSRQSLLYASTGGSTGVPVNYYHDNRYAYEVASAGIWRAWSWAGIRPGDRHLYIWGGPREIEEAKSFQWKVKHFFLRRIFVDAFEMSLENLDFFVRRAKRFKPRLIYGYASSVTAFAQYVEEQRVTIPGVKAVMTTAERLLPEQRKIINNAFKCKVFDQYACREVRSVASECSHGKLHLNTDLNIVEFVKLADHNINDGKEFIVLTPLELKGFPLLRYVNEDLGEPDTVCDCGLPFPTMKLMIGRVTDNFTLRSGKIIHGEYFTHLVYGFKGIKQFQFHQVAKDHIIFRIVCNRPDYSSDTLKRIKEMISEAEAYVGEGCKIELREVNEIQLSSSGKYRFTLSDVTLKQNQVIT